MTYWDYIRIANVAVLLVLLVTITSRYFTGVRMLDPRNQLGDPSHLGLLRMGQILLYSALIEGFVEGLITGLPGGPRIIVPLPGLLLILLSAHWGRAYRWTSTITGRIRAMRAARHH